MSLDDEFDNLRGAINECAGYRVLDDADVLQRGDETVCGSTYLSGSEEWHVMDGDDWSEYFGHTVDWANSAERDELDASERLFRRRLDTTARVARGGSE